MLKVHWLTITWYSSYASCFKISILTKLSEYNLRAIRYNTSWKGGDSTNHPMASQSLQSEEFTDTRIWHSQTLFVDWCLFKALWQGDSVSKYKPT